MAQIANKYHFSPGRNYLTLLRIYFLITVLSGYLFLFGSGQDNGSNLSIKQRDSLPDKILNNLFWTAFRESRFEDAMDYGEKYYNIASQEKDLNKIFESLTNMFVLYLQTGNYEKSFDYAEQLYDIALNSENKHWIQTSLWGLGQLYADIEDYSSSLNYYRRAYEINNGELETLPVETESGTRFEMQFAEVFSLTNQFDSAFYYYKKYLPSGAASKRYYLVSFGEYYLLKGDFQMALRQFQRALAENQSYSDVNELMRIVLDMAKAYLALNNPQAALKYAREGLSISLKTRAVQYSRDGYRIISDSYNLLGRTDSSNSYFRKYTVLKDVVLNDQAKGRIAAFNYRQRIALINKEKEIQAIQLQKQTLIKDFLIASLIILILLAFTLFRNIDLKRKSEARRRELAENELHIQKLESEKARVELLQQRADLEMKALRAQMNPHFIFNCLNSINRFIIRNDAEKAADYLTKFAKLIRMVLEKSGNSFIPLEEELACLKLYMDLEGLRFEKPFIYEINCIGMESSSVMVPSLMIQPFIENAIWHGLHPSPNSPAKISLNLHLENELLICEIADNGIGLKASDAGKKYSEGGKKSLGIELTKNRLKLADPRYHESTEVKILDLVDESGKNCGTSVRIQIPVRRI